MRLVDMKKQIIVGLLIAVLPTSTYGIFNLYGEVQENSKHRHGAVQVEEDIKTLKMDVHELRKDVCWIKEHLRGAKVPDCSID